MEGHQVCLIDQPKLPHLFQIQRLDHHTQTANAISTMIVRGAGAIGATGAAGMAQAFIEAPNDETFQKYIDTAAETLRNTRPTAQNLFYGIQKVPEAAKTAQSREEAFTALWYARLSGAGTLLARRISRPVCPITPALRRE